VNRVIETFSGSPPGDGTPVSIFLTKDSFGLAEFLAKVEHVGHEIAASRFYKRPAKWCSWCDYLPICTGDAATTRETLVQIG
jgi:hypothetical protein